MSQALTQQYVNLQTALFHRAVMRRIQDEEGQDFLEYIIIVGFALLVVSAVAALYGAINGKFMDAAAAVGGISF